MLFISSILDSMNSIFLFERRLSKFDLEPVERSSIINIFSISLSSKAFTKLVPINPAPPVIITFFITVL